MTTVPYTFGNEESPIPLSQLDANFAVTPQFANTAGNVTNNVQANITTVGTLAALSVTGNINAGNLRTTGQLSTTGNITTGNILTGGAISALGTVTGGSVCATGNIIAGNITTGGFVSATGNVIGGNVTTSGFITAVGNIITQSQISATGNITTAANFVGNFLGNITGNIVGAPGSNTQVTYNLNGNLDAVGGLTYNKDSNVLTILGQVNTQTLVVSGTSQLIGVVTAPTAPNATSNNQVATTAFVQNQINQNATNVAITGGTITVTSLTASGGDVTANTFNTTNWTVREYSGNLFFQYLGANKAKLDSNGNFTTTGNVTAFGTL
jgi:hypothetical protein